MENDYCQSQGHTFSYILSFFTNHLRLGQNIGNTNLLSRAIGYTFQLHFRLIAPTSLNKALE